MRIRNGSKIKVPNCIDDADCKLTLHRNCRNTKEIASTSQKPLPQDKYSYGLLQIPGSGKKPHMYAVENAAEQQTYVNRAIDCLRADGYDDIVILTMNTLTNSILSDSAQALGNGDYNRMYSYAGKQYLFSNCSKFKGLEADAIILIDIDVAAFNEKAMYFYVGTSRARTRLELIANLSLEDCGKVAKVLDETAPSRKNMVPILKNILGCDIDIV